MRIEIAPKCEEEKRPTLNRPLRKNKEQIRIRRSKKMNNIARTILFVFIVLVSVGSISAQKGLLGPPLWEDTAINPHDFTDAYYLMNGINPKTIIDRRTGTDGLSVISNSSNPFHTNVRVIATAPAYDQNGDMLFWFPLGELRDLAMNDDQQGERLREMAMRSPMYIFPDSTIVEFRTFANNRQAALIDNSWAMTGGKDANPLGLRMVYIVNYTEKAFEKESVEMMMYLRKKNGASADDTPIIRTIDDLRMLQKSEMVALDEMKIIGGRYALGPTITDPTRGAIAPDAYLWMATKDDRPLPGEDLFVWQFHCLQKTGNWCP